MVKKFILADDVEVGSASIQDGILGIPITKIIPEEKKPRKISIGNKKLPKEFLQNTVEDFIKRLTQPSLVVY